MNVDLAFIILGFLIGNAVLGAAVWAFIDDKYQHLYTWFKDADEMGFIGPFIQFATLHLWPIGLWFWWRSKY